MQTPMTLETQIGQMCFVGFEGLTAPDYLLEWLQSGRIGGVILFARNIESPQQVAALTDSLQTAAPYGAIISIDQEGGTVARLRAGFTEIPGAMALASAPDAETHVENAYGVLAAEMRALGIHWDYAPVVDLTYTAANPSVGTRSFGNDPARVGALAAAVVRGLQGGGVAACAKHFPGLGDTAIDTHQALPVLATPLDHLVNVDLAPYRAVINADIASIMITHTVFSALDNTYPATLSPLVVRRLLRETLGYDGVVSTDCMEMRAITEGFGTGESAVLAALAGIDAILFSHTHERQVAVYDALLAAAQSERLPLPTIADANRRLTDFKARYLLPRADVRGVASPQHRARAQTAARAGIVLARGGASLPLSPDQTVGVVEFASVLESGIVEVGGLTGFAQRVRERLPTAEIVIWSDKHAAAAEALADRVDTLIIATRSAHLNPDQHAHADRLIARAARVIVVALRNPYDADLFPSADSIVCTNGDSVPLLQAAVDLLMGDFAPTGTLPIPSAVVGKEGLK